MAPWQENLSGSLWRSIFYTEFTIVRTAIIMPILIMYLVLLQRIVGTRGDNESSLINRIASVAMGAFIATAPLRASTPLATAVVGITILSTMNLLLNTLYWSGILSKHSIAPKPVLIVARGQLLPSQMRKVLLTPDKVQSELRKAGLANLEDVLAAVMEPSGHCSIIPYGPGGVEPGKLSLLQSVDGYEQYLAHQPQRHVATTVGAPMGPAVHVQQV